MSRTRYRIFEDGHPYFLTCTIVGWLPVFTRPESAQIILDSWRFLQSQGRLSVFGYVLMENHLHFIAKGKELSKEVGDFKSFTARKIIDLLQQRKAVTILRQFRYEKARYKTDRPHQVWQEGSQPKKIENAEMMVQKLEYMHSNPVKRGYVDETVHWRYSSARNYAGLPGLIEVITDWT
jgi:REP element-mobilizing transposase RayT